MLETLSIDIKKSPEEIVKNNILTSLQKSLLIYIIYNKNVLEFEAKNYSDNLEKLISFISKDFRESFDDILNCYKSLLYKGLILELISNNIF